MARFIQLENGEYVALSLIGRFRKVAGDRWSLWDKDGAHIGSSYENPMAVGAQIIPAQAGWSLNECHNGDGGFWIYQSEIFGWALTDDGPNPITADGTIWLELLNDPFFIQDPLGKCVASSVATFDTRSAAVEWAKKELGSS